MYNKDSNVRNEISNIISKAKLVPTAEHEGEKIGLFSGFNNLTIIKDSKVTDAKGIIIRRLI